MTSARNSGPFIYETDPDTGELVSVVNTEYQNPRKATLTKAILDKSGIPSEYRGLTFNKIGKHFVKSRKSFERLTNYGMSLKNPDLQERSVYLWGPSSSGKTSLAAGLGGAFAQEGLTVKYVLSGDLTMWLHDSFSYEAEESKHNLREAEMVDLLILDGVFDDTKSFLYRDPKTRMKMVAAWDRLLRTRLPNGKRICFVSSEDIEKSKTYSMGIYDLMKRHCEVFYFEDDIATVKRASRQSAEEILNRPIPQKTKEPEVQK